MGISSIYCKSMVFDKLIGKWAAVDPLNSEDYSVVYVIRKWGTGVRISAYDYRDGEKMHISNVEVLGDKLSFISTMPSTGRKGKNVFRVKKGAIVAEFTFTVVEGLKRIDL